MKQPLTEEDLEKIFIASRYKKKSSLVVFFKFFGLFILFFALIYIGLNFSAYQQKIAFWYNDQFSGENNDALSSLIISSGDINRSEIGSRLPNISDNHIFIDSIGVDAPVTFEVKNDEQTVAENLKKGTIQLSGTALPGEIGNVFITGHSSNFFWTKGNYNSVFATLDKVVIGNAILVKFHNQNYLYHVTDIFVTTPTNVSVLEPIDSQSTITLMTCSPVGTNLKRLIVRAKQVYPDPSQNVLSGLGDGSKKLPEGVR